MICLLETAEATLTEGYDIQVILLSQREIPRSEQGKGIKVDIAQRVPATIEFLKVDHFDVEFLQDRPR
jgi:hypothetical protein